MSEPKLVTGVVPVGGHGHECVGPRGSRFMSPTLRTLLVPLKPTFYNLNPTL